MRRLLLSALLAVTFLSACGGPVDEAGLSDAPTLAENQADLCASQPQYLANPAFTTVGPNGASTTVTTLFAGGAGNSAAANWTLFTNNPGTITTTLSSGMIHVTTNKASNGLVQVFAPINTGPTRIISSVRVWVNSGQVGVGVGNGGNTSLSAFTSTTGAWQTVQTANANVPANEIAIYSVGGPADFWVDSASVQFSPNLLSNPTFATVGPSGSSTSVTTLFPGGAGNSASANWTLFTNNPGPITTQLVPSTLTGMTRMLHVHTAADRNGVVQVFPGSASCTTNGPAHTKTGIYVFVNSGRVGIGTGNGGASAFDAFSTTIGAWQYLEAPNGVSPSNEVFVYASTTNGADFYVGFASVNEVP